MADDSKKQKRDLGNPAGNTKHLSSPAHAVQNGDILTLQLSLFKALGDQVQALGKQDCTVIIKAEKGTAKEILAHRLHLNSPRAGKPFIPVDCGLLKGRILHNQLFGRTELTPKGKHKAVLGAFRTADGGTVFLDEIDSLETDSQAKVLQVLQQHSVKPNGSNEKFPVNVRVICATDKDLSRAVPLGRFIHDLYSLLNAATLELPPLRQRPDDIEKLAHYFLLSHAQMHNEPVKKLEPSALNALKRYTWPGNAGELAAVIERAFVMSRSDKITILDLPAEIVGTDALALGKGSKTDDAIKKINRKLLIKTLEKTKGRKMSAAKLLQIDNHNLNRLIKKFDLEPSAFSED